MSKQKKNVDVRRLDIHFRVNEKEHRIIFNNAEKAGLNVSEYARLAAEGKIGRGKSSGENSEIIVLAQDLVTYVQEKYGCEDNEIEERMEKLWEALL